MKWQKEKLAFWGGAEIQRFKFANGLKLLVAENKVAPVFSYQTWYNVGSRDEKPLYSGIAHLFEHMMFKETKNLKPGVFDKTMESAGARDLNAFTSTDYTAYVQSLPKESLELVAQLESERMLNLALTKELFESEREVVHNERKQRNENNPDGQMFEELQKLAFAKHPYGRPVIGFEEDLNRMTTKDCEEFYDAFYAPNNAVIAVSGDVKGDAVAKILQKYYGKIESSQIPETKPAIEPEQKEERVKILSLAIQVEKAYMAYKIPSAEHPDHVPISVLTTILSTGRSSRLYKALVDKGLSIDVGTGAHPSKDEGLLYVSFTAQAGKKAQQVIDTIDMELQKLASHGVSSEELERAKNKLQTEFYMGLGSNSARAHFMGQNESVLGDVSKAIYSMKSIDDVSLAQVKSVAERYLHKNRRSIVIGVPGA